MRILIRLLLIAVAAWLIWRALIAPARPKRARRITEETMQRCAHCGTFVPEADAVRTGDLYFCSTQHLEQHRR